MAGLAGYTTGILINSPMPKPPVFFIRFYRNIFIVVEFDNSPCKRIDILQLCALPPPFQTVGVAGDPFHLRRKQHYSWNTWDLSWWGILLTLCFFRVIAVENSSSHRLQLIWLNLEKIENLTDTEEGVRKSFTCLFAKQNYCEILTKFCN